MKKIDFATTLTDSQSYIGDLALPYVTAAFLKNKTADSGVKIVDNIVLKAYVAKLTGSNLLHIGGCDFSPNGTIVAGEVALEPKPFAIDIELCYDDLQNLWNGLNNGNLNTQEPGSDLVSALQDVLINAMNEGFEDTVWNGVYNSTGTTVTSNFNGIDSQITTNVITGATGLTATNIIAAVDATVAALPSVVLEDVSNLKIYMNPKTLLFYKQALMAKGINTPADAMPTTYDGIPIYDVTKIADDRIYAIQPQNIALGLGAMDNFSQLVIKDMRESTLDNKVRMKLQGKADVKVIFEAEASKWYYTAAQ